MKCLLLRKWTVCFFFGLLLSSMLPGIQAKAAETTETEFDNSGILQSGGLLKEEETPMSLRGRSSGNITGARQAIIDALDKIAPTVDLTAYQISISELKSLVTSTINNNPRFFYYGNSYKYSYNPSNDQVTVVTFNYTEDESAIRPKIIVYEQAVQNILGNIQPSWSDFEKAMYVNDYLAVNCEYDTTKTKHSAYNMLVEGTAVCQGYALAYQELMGRLGIPCQMVSSVLLNHAWNLVQVNGSWYHVDVTWNDPTSDRLGRARHFYLLKSTGWFQSSTGKHIKDGKTDYVYSDGATDATAYSQMYDDYFWNDIDSPFGYYNGYWYGNKGSVLYKYQFGSTGMTDPNPSVLKALNQKWPVFNGSGTWDGTHDGCIVYGNKLYYATPTSIKVLELANPTATEKTVFTLSSEQQNRGYIYGFCIDSDGNLHYGISDSPNNEAATYSQPLHTHTYGGWTVTKAATCTEDGERQQICTDCGVTVNTESIEATGHEYGGWTLTKEATCTEDGERQQICANCDTPVNTESIETTGHQYGGWTVTKEATCTEEGERQQICSKCGAENTESIATTEHEYGAWTVTKEATCTEKGQHQQVCSNCGTVNTEPIEATGHEYGAWTVTKAVTCTEEGERQQVCFNCETVNIETIAATGHQYGAWTVTKAATCTEKGQRQQVCSNCGTVKSESIAAIGHRYGVWTVTKAATCTEEGERQQVCSNCRTAKSESIKATGHLHKKTATKAATFMKTGKTVVTCQDCNTVIESKTIAKIKCKKGQTYTVGNYKYKIVSPKTTGKGTVSFVGLAKNVNKVTIGDTVKILGVNFKIVQIGDKALKNKSSVTSVTIGKNVTSIGKEAFSGTKKLKTVTIKSTKITKVGANAFKNIYSKAKIKVPKAKLKKYKALMKNKGQKSTVKIS